MAAVALRLAVACSVRQDALWAAQGPVESLDKWCASGGCWHRVLTSGGSFFIFLFLICLLGSGPTVCVCVCFVGRERENRTETERYHRFVSKQHRLSCALSGGVFFFCISLHPRRCVRHNKTSHLPPPSCRLTLVPWKTLFFFFFFAT